MRPSFPVHEFVYNENRINELADDVLAGKIHLRSIEEVQAPKQLSEEDTKCAHVTYERTSLSVREVRTSNVFLSLYVTAFSRLHLRDCMDRLGEERVVYCDTDSIFVATNEDMDELCARVGIDLDPTELGKWKNETTTKYRGRIVDISILAPKSYCFVVLDEHGELHTITRIKGIRFDHQTSEIITPELMKAIIENKEMTMLHVDEIHRDHLGNVFNKKVTKTFRFEADKRLMLDDNFTVPFGFSAD